MKLFCELTETENMIIRQPSETWALSA